MRMLSSGLLGSRNRIPFSEKLEVCMNYRGFSENENISTLACPFVHGQCAMIKCVGCREVSTLLFRDILSRDANHQDTQTGKAIVKALVAFPLITSFIQCHTCHAPTPTAFPLSMHS